MATGSLYMFKQNIQNAYLEAEFQMFSLTYRDE